MPFICDKKKAKVVEISLQMAKRAGILGRQVIDDTEDAEDEGNGIGDSDDKPVPKYETMVNASDRIESHSEGVTTSFRLG